MKLSLAGMISGAGEGAGKALLTAQAGMIQSQLLQERADLENKRLELAEQYAKGREERGYAHAESTLEKQQEFTRAENIASRTSTETIHEQDRTQAKAISDKTEARLTNEGTWRREDAKAAHDLALATLQATKDKVTLVPLGDGTFQKVRSDGKTLGLAKDPNTNTPLQGPKDLPAATKLLGETIKTIIAGNQSRMKTPGILPDEAQALAEENNRLMVELKNLLNLAPQQQKPVQVVIPPGMEPPGSKSTEGEAGMITSPSTPRPKGPRRQGDVTILPR